MQGRWCGEMYMAAMAAPDTTLWATVWAQHATPNKGKTHGAHNPGEHPQSCLRVLWLRGPHTTQTALGTNLERYSRANPTAIPTTIPTKINARAAPAETPPVAAAFRGASSASRPRAYAARARLAGGFSCTAVLILKAASMACASRVG